MAFRINRFRLPSLFTRALFRREARKETLKIGDYPVGTLVPKEMSTGSVGWTFQGKYQKRIGGALVWVQVSCNCTVIQSKDLPPDPPKAP